MSEKTLLSRWTSDNYILSVASVLTSIRTSRRYSGPADLRGLVVGLDGQLPELESLDFQDTELTGIDFSYARFSCSFSRSAVAACLFDKARFDTCRMVSSGLRQVSFKGVTILAPMLDDASIEGCDFTDAALRGRGAKAYGARRAEFHGCAFDRVRFIGLELRACKFTECRFSGAVFQRCLLAGVRFQGGGPSQEQFDKCDLQSTGVG